MNIDLPVLLERVTTGPAKCFGLPQGKLEAGAPADLCIIDTEANWEFSTDHMLSTGKNSPYHGWDFSGQVNLTVVNGKTVYSSRKT